MQKNVINYLILENNTLRVFYSNELFIEERKSSLKFIKELFINNLFTYNAYKENINYFLKIKRLIPLYINPKTQLIYFKSLDQDQVIINYSSIKNILKSKQSTKYIIIFNDDSQLKFNKNYNLLLKKIKQLKQVKVFLKKQQDILELK